MTKPGREPLENLLWPIFAAVFPLVVVKPAYDSFHEPKWLFLTAFAGLILLLRASRGVRVISPQTPLEAPALLCLVATLVAWRWEAADRWISFHFWLRLLIGYVVFRLQVTWLLEKGPEDRGDRIGRVLDAFVMGGAGVAVLAILQDWGILRWGEGPVSDWRFHLSSTLGNPNEVGGYLSYLLPIVLVRWFQADGRVLFRVRWGILGLLYLYALTTVFTVGAWLGLIVVLPLVASVLSLEKGKRKIGSFVGVVVVSGLVFLLLQGVLRVPGTTGNRILVFGVLSLVCCAAVMVYTTLFFGSLRTKATLAIVGLIGVWTILLLPWGLPNHPDGLVKEAVSSPRWKGGFGARRFIWNTTGLMVKDHPVRGIGWGHYYTVHALYQGEVYRQRDLPHDRPTVGLVPQVHSDPLQILAESGAFGSLAFLWLAAAAFFLGARRIRRTWPALPSLSRNLWVCWAGLGLVGFHCAVDFPLRQPQPVFLSIFFLSAIASVKPDKLGALGSKQWVTPPPNLPLKGEGPAPLPTGEELVPLPTGEELVPLPTGEELAPLPWREGLGEGGRKGIAVLAGAFLLIAAAIGIRDQIRLKRGFEDYRMALGTTDPQQSGPCFFRRRQTPWMR